MAQAVAVAVVDVGRGYRTILRDLGQAAGQIISITIGRPDGVDGLGLFREAAQFVSCIAHLVGDGLQGTVDAQGAGDGGVDQQGAADAVEVAVDVVAGNEMNAQLTHSSFIEFNAPIF